MTWNFLTTIQIPNNTQWLYSPPIPQIQFIRLVHNLSHPVYLEWYGLIAQSLDGPPNFLCNVRRLWPTAEGVIFDFPAFTEPDFFGGTRRIAVRGSKQQPYNLSWSVQIEYWSELRWPVTQDDFDQITDTLDPIEDAIYSIQDYLTIGTGNLTDPYLGANQ